MAQSIWLVVCSFLCTAPADEIPRSWGSRIVLSGTIFRDRTDIQAEVTLYNLAYSRMMKLRLGLGLELGLGLGLGLGLWLGQGLGLELGLGFGLGLIVLSGMAQLRYPFLNSNIW